MCIVFRCSRVSCESECRTVLKNACNQKFPRRQYSIGSRLNPVVHRTQRTPSFRRTVNTMADSGPAGATELTPRGRAAALSGDTAYGSVKKGGWSRVKVLAQKERMGRLCQPVVRRHIMKDLTKEEIKAMVDLAYWSDFDTSRRDAASTFATLSMNDHNVDVLDRAGVLGAVLALITRESSIIQEKRPLSKASADCLQDASWCLRRMLRRDEIKSRFLEAPGGLTNVLALAGSDDVSLRQSAVRILDTLCAFAPAQPAVVREGGARVLVAQLASEDESLRRTAARVVRGLARSPHTTPQSLMDADIVRFLLCLLEEGDEPADEQQETMCIAYFTKVSSDEEACSQLADLGLSRYLIRVLPERRLSLQNRLSMLHALERMANSKRCEYRLIDEGLIEALVNLCFNEVASFVHGCQHYIRQRQEMEGVPLRCGENHRQSASSGGRGGSWGEGGTGWGGGGGGRASVSGASVGGMPATSGVGGRRKKQADPRFTEERLEVALDVARTCMSMFAHLAARGYRRRALHAGVLAHINSVAIGSGDDPHMTGSLSQLVLELSTMAHESEEDRLSFIAQGPLDAILRCLKGGRAGQQQCALDALAKVCLLPELRPLVFAKVVLNEVLMLARVQEHVPSAAIVLHQFALLPEWRSPLVGGGCLELLVNAIGHATGPDASSAELPALLGPVVAAIMEITRLDGAGRVLVAAGGFPLLLRLARSDDDNLRRDAQQALKHTGHNGREYREPNRDRDATSTF